MQRIHYLLTGAVVTLFGILVLGSCSRKEKAISENDLLRLFGNLHPWEFTTNYPQGAWLHVSNACETMARAKPDTIERAMTVFLRDEASTEYFANQTRLFLLLRFYFQLPQHGSPTNRFVTAAWLGSDKATNSDGTINLAWPLKWSGGRPNLVSRCEGYEGPTYRPIEEYHYLRARFPKREL
jgi:hypothetical protein